ncbi:hypothetical protein T11_12398 [Trichinella zimbabwensis]|uniref:MULE transposase domain-containing protein n=1 Tax=Trichinella zimbabwensis TaxID=268475 RepID=A0A0V1HR85_9BILA|nr:hypothetical protein T11_12398 [Trichinella zimbabwensis]
MFNNLMLKPAALELAVLQPQTIICDFETALIPAVQKSFLAVHIQGCLFYFGQVVLQKVTYLGIHEETERRKARKKTVKMLLATAFLPLHDVPAAVELLGRNVTGPEGALFNCAREEWMTQQAAAVAYMLLIMLQIIQL